MKCYHEDETNAAVTHISLADAMLKVCEYHAIDAFSAANMLQLSSSARPVTVMDGTVHIEDDVPVLDIDKVIESWFMIKANLVRALHPHQAFTAMIVCNSGYDAKLTVDYRFSLGYENETKGAASEPTFNEFLRRVDWTKANEAKVLAIDHSPIERS
jgi:hypothetical protein